MTRLRRRPTPPAAATPAGRTRKQKEGQSPAGGKKQQKASNGASPGPAAKPRSGPVDRLRPNLFISPVIGRARARTAKKADLVKPAAQSTATAGGKRSDKTCTAKKRAADATKSNDQTPVSADEKASSRTGVLKKGEPEPATKPAVALEGRTSSQGRAKKERGAAARSAPQATAAVEAKTPSRARAKRERGTDAAQSNTSAAAPPEKTALRAPVSDGRASEPVAQLVPTPKGKTSGRTRAKKESASAPTRSRAAPTSKTPSRTETTAAQADDGQSGGRPKDHTSKPPAVSSSRAKSASAVIRDRAKTAPASAGSHSGTVSKSISTQADTISKPDGRQDSTALASSGTDAKPARPSKPAGSTGTSPMKRSRTDGPPSYNRPSGPAASAAIAATAATSSETSSKRQRLSATTSKAVTFNQKEEVALTPSRFTAILPRPAPPPLPPSSTSAPPPPSKPLPPSAPVTEPLRAVATPRRRRLPRHVTSTPCGPPAPPPPAADSADTCYGFLEDIEAEDAEESVPLEQMVSPVGVSRARALPHRLRDATNLPSRFNVGRLARKPAGGRPEVTTTVASQLMDPEVTFSKPASRSYSRRRHPSAGAGHSTFGHSTLDSETTVAGDATRVKQRRHQKKERDEQEEAEAEKWIASVNSRLSEVDSFELVVERS